MLQNDIYANNVALYISGTSDVPESTSNTLTAISTSDVNSKFVSLLVTGTGSDGKNNNVFRNLVTSETVTRNGNVTQGTFNPTSLAAGYWSNYFDGSGDNLTISDPNGVFSFGTGSFSVETWIYPTASGTGGGSICSKGSGRWWVNPIFMGFDGSGFLYAGFSYSTGTAYTYDVNLVSTTTYASLANKWTHIAFVRNGSTVALYVDGNIVSSIGGFPHGVIGSGNPLIIGQSFRGYLSNFRIVKGSSAYTSSSFTPSSKPLITIANTVLLTCQSNRFRDNSSNNFTITPTGDTTASLLTPFTPVIGDASILPGYWSTTFDGTGDYLTVSNTTTNFGTDDFTIEGWVKTNVVDTSVDTIISNYNTAVNNAMGLYINRGTNGGIQLYSGNTLVVGVPSALAISTWYHIAVVRSSGITTIYVDGIKRATANDTNNYGIDNTVTAIGASRTSGTYGNFLNGLISNLRIVKGSAIYTTPFTLPTRNLTSVSGTTLLTLQNSRMVDNSSNNFSITVAGNTKTTQTGPFATTPNYSYAFNGSTQWLTLGGQSQFAFGTGDFTVEFWYYSNNNGVQQIIYDSRPASVNGAYLAIFKTTSNTIALYVNSAVPLNGTIPLQKEAWYHVAVSRFNGVTRLFIDGDIDGSFADATNYINGASRPAIGVDGSSTSNATKLNGYLSNLRVINGSAIYTSKFTPPSAALTAVFGTALLTAVSNNIADLSSNAFTLTNTGSTAPSTINPINGLYSLYFNGVNEHAVVNHSNAINILSGNFTVEMWFQSDSQGAVTRALAGQWTQQSASTAGWAVRLNSSNNLEFLWGPFSSATPLITSSSTVSNGSWNHVAVTRSGSTFTMYLNGAVVGTASSSTTAAYLAVNTTVGNYYNSSAVIGASGISYYKGFIASFRILEDVAYSGAFTPSTSPLVVDAYRETTGLLMAQSNDGCDISGNNLVVTLTGTNIRVSQETPFSNMATSSSANKAGVLLGGSTYFDGTADYLSIPANDSFVPQANEDFTIEFWARMRNLPASPAVIMSSGWPTANCPFMFSWDGTSAIKFYSSSNGSSWDVANAVTIASNPKENIWYHFAASRRNGVIRLFLNGSLVTSINSTAGLYRTALYPVTLMADASGASTAAGFMAGVRILRGSGVYTSNFIPSAAPSDVLASSSLHMNFRNAGVFDSTNQQIVETVGDAAISTVQSRNGGSSIYFDGTDDHLFTSNDELAWGTGDFTVQFWMRSADVSSASQRGIFQISSAAGAITSDLTTGLSLYQGLTVNNDALDGAISGNLLGVVFGTTTAVLTADTWTHIAIVRSSGTVSLYVNGSSVDVKTSTGYVSANAMAIGGYSSSNNMFSGYIDDFKISTEASYTGNFTPV